MRDRLWLLFIQRLQLEAGLCSLATALIIVTLLSQFTEYSLGLLLFNSKKCISVQEAKQLFWNGYRDHATVNI